MDIVEYETPQAETQHAQLAVRFGRKGRLRADVTVTPLGLLSIGALVSSILLSTAVIVRAARDR
jgi:hypothetical protein